VKTLSTAAVAVAFALASCGGADLGNSPDTRGMVLPEAEKALKKAGYAASVEDDALFGVIVPSHFTVCEQSEINSRMVKLEVAKHGC
jgi:hypothetical protein